jgi:sugar phosphate isomerase/epimerase
MTGDPRFSICQFTTPDTTFEEDLRALTALGVAGISICEYKLRPGEEAEQLRAFRGSGLQAAICMPVNISPLPTSGAVFPGPEDLEERIELMCGSVRRLAPFEPASIVVITGAIRGREPEQARAAIVEGLRQVAAVAADAGLRLGLEPQRVDMLPGRTLVSTIPEAVDLLGEVGADNIDIVYDTYHLFDTPNIEELTRTHARYFGGVQVCDLPKKPQGWMDRVLPGDGIIDLPTLLAALDEGGFTGWYDLEIFSDDGRYGTNLPDSLWKRPPTEVLTAGREAFFREWNARRKLGSGV